MAERKLIDGNALLKEIEEIDWYHVNGKGHLVHGANPSLNLPLYKAGDILEVVANASEAQIRCKECKWSEYVVYNGEALYRTCKVWRARVGSEDYCSKARKGETQG